MRRDINHQLREAITVALQDFRSGDKNHHPNLLAVYVPKNYASAKDLSIIAKACETIGGEVDPRLRTAIFDIRFTEMPSVQAEALRFSADELEDYVFEHSKLTDHNAVLIDKRSASVKTPKYVPDETPRAMLRWNDVIYAIEDGCIIGRCPESKTGASLIKFPEEHFGAMSRTHASFHYSKQKRQWRYQDENSTNGTRITQLGNTNPVGAGDSVFLENGATIWIAKAPPITFISSETSECKNTELKSNLSYVETALEYLAHSLRPYVSRRLKQEFGNTWWEEGVIQNVTEEQRRKLNGKESRGANSLDIAMLLRISRRMQAKTSGEFIRGFTSSEIDELIEARNAIAHKTPDEEKTYDTWKTKRSLTQAEQLCEILEFSMPDRDNAKKLRGLRKDFELTYSAK